jgi:hypothetical protein
MKTLLLDQTTWDLVIDVSGNIAVADVPYAQAQDASSMFRTFRGEVWYDTNLGIRLDRILNQPVNLTYSRAQLHDAALLVPGIMSAEVFFSSFTNRKLSGQASMTNSNGQTVVAGF